MVTKKRRSSSRIKKICGPVSKRKSISRPTKHDARRRDLAKHRAEEIKRLKKEVRALEADRDAAHAKAQEYLSQNMIMAGWIKNHPHWRDEILEEIRREPHDSDSIGKLCERLNFGRPMKGGLPSLGKKT
jgi:hypothetical protein